MTKNKPTLFIAGATKHDEQAKAKLIFAYPIFSRDNTYYKPFLPYKEIIVNNDLRFFNF
jgi:hypothetical protein